ncbi:MAG: hypothetical protein Udaeo2_14390 [Candidatus Udaeobacter sp.]|jgi:hypothetical protein|nr:MAG: hypothetical protein Udaeo2_14390 [Candidatus Udaeobacter sp.]
MLFFGLFLIDETAGWRLVWDGPTEIDLDIHDLVFAHRDDLGIAEPAPVGTTPFIDDEYPVAVGHELDEIETLDVLAVRPATRKVGRAANPVIKWAGKWKSRAISLSTTSRSLAT